MAFTVDTFLLSIPKILCSFFDLLFFRATSIQYGILFYWAILDAREAFACNCNSWISDWTFTIYKKEAYPIARLKMALQIITKITNGRRECRHLGNFAVDEGFDCPKEVGGLFTPFCVIFKQIYFFIIAWGWGIWLGCIFCKRHLFDDKKWENCPNRFWTYFYKSLIFFSKCTNKLDEKIFNNAFNIDTNN